MPKRGESTPSRSDGLRAAGGALYDSVADRFDLDQHEHQLLLEAARTADTLADLDAAARKGGPIVDTPQGPRANPAIVEARAQRITLARLLAALRMPAGAEGDQQATARPQRRSGARAIRDQGRGVVRRKTVEAPARPPMWVASYAHWQEFRGVAEPERFVLHTQAVEEWIERFGQRPGFDPFDEEGASELEAAEAAIRAGEVW